MVHCIFPLPVPGMMIPTPIPIPMFLLDLIRPIFWVSKVLLKRRLWLALHHHHPKNKKKKIARYVNQVQVNVNDHIASLVIPDCLENYQIFCVNIYTAGLRAVTKDVTKFIDGMNCAICHKLHSFDQCPILNDIPYIKKHFISYCLQMNKTQKQILAVIHHIDATWGTDINNDNDDDDDDDDEDYLHANTDNDVNFQEEEESYPSLRTPP